MDDRRLHLALWPADPGAAWPLAAPDLELVVAESDGELTMEALRRETAEGNATLVLVSCQGSYAGALVIEEAGRYLNIVAARMRYTTQRAFGQVLGILGGLAAERGLQLCGWSRRPGMGRLLERYGWRARFVEYVAPAVNRARVPDLEVGDGR